MSSPSLTSTGIFPQPIRANSHDGYFGFDTTSIDGRAKTMARLAELAQLPAEIRHEATLFPREVNAELILGNFGEVEACLDHIIHVENVNLAGFVGPMTTAGRQTLRILDSHFDSYMPGRRWLEEDAAGRLIPEAQTFRETVVTNAADLGDETTFFPA